MLVLMFVTKESLHIDFADDMYYGDDDGSIQESKEGELSYNEFKEGLYERILNKVCGKDVIRESDKLLFLFSMST